MARLGRSVNLSNLPCRCDTATVSFRTVGCWTVAAIAGALLDAQWGMFQVAIAAEKNPPSAPAGLVLVEGGSFQMGDVFGDGKSWQPETPVHEVVVDSFYIARHEVTLKEFREFADATGYRTSAEKHEAAYLYDMSGNAWEWCTDVLGDYPTTKRVNPYVPGDEPRILRGGCTGADARGARVSSRACFGRADHCGNSGFRLARTAETASSVPGAGRIP